MSPHTVIFPSRTAPPAVPPPPPTPPAFARYMLRTGPYAGHHLALVAAADPAWLLATFADPTVDALDATAVRGFVNAHPPLLVGNTWVAGAGHLLTIAPAVADAGDGTMGDGPQWVERVAGEEVGRFTQLHLARRDGEGRWGVRQWLRVDATRVLVGKATQRLVA